MIYFYYYLDNMDFYIHYSLRKQNDTSLPQGPCNPKFVSGEGTEGIEG